MSSIQWAAPLFGIAVGLIAFISLATVFGEERQVARRLRTMTEHERAQAAEIQPLTRSFTDRVGAGLGARASRLVRSLMPTAYAERLRLRIRMSGARRRLTPELLVLLKFALGLAGLGFGVFLRSAFPAAPLLSFSVTALSICVGFFGPDAWLSNRIEARQKAIRRALPDMLDMLMVSVEAGLGFDAALKKVVASTRGPLSEEFAVVLQEIQGGLPRREALQHLTTRTGAAQLNAFIMAIVQADVFGVSVAQVLRTQAQEMRVRRRQYAEEAAQKAPAKMVFPLILCVLPATLIVVGGPAVIAIMRAFGAGF